MDERPLNKMELGELMELLERLRDSLAKNAAPTPYVSVVDDGSTENYRLDRIPKINHKRVQRVLNTVTVLHDKVD